MRKKLLSLALVLAMCLSLVPAAFAADAQPVSSNNKNKQDYTTWSKPVTSYLYENSSGGLTRVEYTNSQIIVEDYNSSFQLQASRTVPMELSIWGGFYAGKDYNFLIFGQSNPSQSDSAEVIRVVKYDKNWTRQGQASLKGANTTVPFDAGSLRCDEYNGYLFLRTAHEMYKSSDGLNHQSNLTMAVKQSDMSITDSFYKVMNSAYGYVSHSFNQFLIVDADGKVVCLDHGDAYPRGVAFTKYYADAGTGKFSTTIISGRSCAGGSVFDFAGQTGANATGGSIGGLAETSSHYVFSFNYNGTGSGSGDRYVYFQNMKKSDGIGKSFKITTSGGSTTPVLASTGLDGGYMLWNGKSGSTVNDTLYYLAYTADGQPGTIQTATGSLSDCQPITYNGKVVWYTTSNSAPTFYTLDSSGVTATPTGGTSSVSDPGTAATPAPTATPEPDPTPSPSQQPSTPGAAQAGIMSNPMVPFSIQDAGSKYVRSDGALIASGAKISDGALAFEDAENGTFFLLKQDGTLWCQPIPLPGESTPPLTKVLDNVVQVQRGLALKQDGSVWADEPAPDSGEEAKAYTMYHLMDGAKQISGSILNGMAVKQDGTLWTWGYQLNNCLGRSVSNSNEWSAPAKILDNVAYATAGMAIKTDGTLWSWGCNTYGAVGDGSGQDQVTPVKIMDNVIGAWCSSDISGDIQKYALTRDGALYSWGSNRNDCLGYSGGNKTYTTGSFSTPYQDIPRKTSVTDVVNMYPFFNGAQVQKSDGTVWLLGGNGLAEKTADNVKVLSGGPVVSTTTTPTNPTNPSQPSLNFTDVKSSDFFAQPVNWAIQKEITNGTSTTSFSPYDTCTVAEILTFLWRSQGQPEPAASTSFSNVNPASYYAKAARWAKDKGLVAGTTFGANAPCTRSMVVTYLWKLAGSPSAGNSGFSDVPSNVDYARAVSWAVNQGITNGTSPTTFSPAGTCTRGEIVTFLYRAYAE